MTKQYDYIGTKYTQGKSEEELLTFCASANDIRAWGGVPTKTERFHGGFQRALSERYQKIVKFFDDGQISPTSIVVAFRQKVLQVSDLAYPPAWRSPNDLSEKPSFVHISFALDEYDPETEDIKKLAQIVCEMLAPRLEDSNDATAMASSELETEEETDEAEDVSDNVDAPNDEMSLSLADDVSADEAEEDSLEIDVGQSKLRAFYDFLNNPNAIDSWITAETAKYERLKTEKRRSRAVREFLTMTPLQRLKASLVSLLRPAMIVDGQHRVWGAYASTSSPITFTVCAIKDSDWVEQVFQFVVLNKLAKPISSSFLTALLNTSLTNEELKDIEPRLSVVGISNTDRVLMKYLNFSDQSPFFGMVSQPGEMAGADDQGKLSDKGMLRVAKRWYNLTLASSEIKMFLPALGVEQITKARRMWKKHEVWTSYFYAFWQVLRDKYQRDGMWEKKEKYHLLYIVTLLTLQDVFLKKKAEGDAIFENMENFKRQVDRFFEKVPGTFFQAWQMTGLQSGKGPEYIEKALMDLRTGKQLGTVQEHSPLFRKA